jgi:hypothetical protein
MFALRAPGEVVCLFTDDPHPFYEPTQKPKEQLLKDD